MKIAYILEENMRDYTQSIDNYYILTKYNTLICIYIVFLKQMYSVPKLYYFIYNSVFLGFYLEKI